MIDVADSRLAKTQRAALHAGRSTSIKWQYDAHDNMTGAYCDGVWFEKDELLKLSTL